MLRFKLPISAFLFAFHASDYSSDMCAWNVGARR